MLKFYISKLLKRIFQMSSVNRCNIHKTAKIGDGCTISNTVLGKYSYVGDNTNISTVRVGNFTSISSYCGIGGGGHPTDWVSTSPVFNKHRSILRVNFSQNEYNPYKETVIGNDVWIGTHCLIKSGITIADGAVIGMGSVVTKDVGPYEIWAGNPAKLIRKRFDDETIDLLVKSEWWNWEDEKIKKHADSFNSLKDFKKILELNDVE